MLPSRSEIEAVAARLPPPRVIMDREGKAPYLSRYYLIGAPRMADGSNPFDERGEPREGALWESNLGVYLHCFRQSDTGAHHNHPFKWSSSLILVGGYEEDRIEMRGDVVRRTKKTYLPGDTNEITENVFHKVELLDGECWTLFTVGSKNSSWGFLLDHGEFVHWRNYLYGEAP